jgi:hypothetical protein
MAKIIAIGSKISVGGRMDNNPFRRPKREHTIDNATQVVDLTTEIRITSSEAVSHGGFSDIYRGEWDHYTATAVSPNGGSNVDVVTHTQVRLAYEHLKFGLDTSLPRLP